MEGSLGIVRIQYLVLWDKQIYRYDRGTLETEHAISVFSKIDITAYFGIYIFKM